MLSTEAIDVSFQDYYDPNGYLTGFFKSSGTKNLLHHLLENRKTPIELLSQDGVVSLSGRELLAVELAHEMLITEGNYTQAQCLDLDQSQLQQCIEIANFGALQIVKGVRAGVDVLLEDNFELNRLTEERDPQRLLVTGAVLGAVAHRGETRLSGLPYIYHPIAVAAIAGIAARKEGDVLSDEEKHVLRLVQYVGLGHDTHENNIESTGPERGSSFLTKRDERVVASPLVHYMVLRSLGLDKDESFSAARDILMLTKTVGPEKKGRMKYSKYAARLFSVKKHHHGETRMHLKYPIATVVKQLDLHDNRVIDPKRVEPVDKKHEKQRRAVLRLKNQQNNYRKVSRTGERRVRDSDAHYMLRRISRNIQLVKPSDLDDFKGSGRILAILRENDMLLAAWDEGQHRLVA